MAKERCDVFISYSRKDLELVKKIKAEIDRLVGIDCWMDLDGIESGEQFEDVIINAICKCDTILFMMSANSMQSEWALDELDFAKHEKKRIVLVGIDNTEMSGKFYFRYHKYDTITWNDISQHNKLIKDLTKWLEKKEGTSSLACNNAIPQKEIHSYGILMIREDGSSFVYNVIKKTDPLIVEKTIYCAARCNQTAATIDVYQTDSCEDEVEIDECIHLFKKELSWGEPLSIETTFSRSSNGSINVTVECMNKRFTYNIIS